MTNLKQLSERVLMLTIVGTVGLCLTAISTDYSVKVDVQTDDRKILIEANPIRANQSSDISAQSCANQNTNDPHQQHQDRRLHQSNHQALPQALSCNF